MILTALFVSSMAAPAIAENPAIHDSSTALSLDLAGQTPPVAKRIIDGRTYVRFGHGFVAPEDSHNAGPDVEFRAGPVFSAAIGKRSPALIGPLDLDLEFEAVLTRREARNDSSNQPVEDATTAAFLFNGTVDYTLRDRLSVYAGAGFGPAWVDVGTRSDAATDVNVENGPFLAWQARTGVEWRFVPGVTGNLGLRVLDVGDVHVHDNVGNANFDLETRQHAIEAGVRFDL